MKLFKKLAALASLSVFFIFAAVCLWLCAVKYRQISALTAHQTWVSQVQTSGSPEVGAEIRHEFTVEQGEKFRAPFSGEKCAAARTVVEAVVNTGEGSHSILVWEKSTGPKAIKLGSVSAKPDQLLVFASDWTESKSLPECVPPEKSYKPVDGGSLSHYRIREVLLLPGSKLFVAGVIGESGELRSHSELSETVFPGTKNDYLESLAGNLKSQWVQLALIVFMALGFSIATIRGLKSVRG